MARHSIPQSEDVDEQFLFEPAESPVDRSSSRAENHGGDDHDTVRTSDREELIQCIKRGQRTTWVPKPGLEALCAEVEAEQNAAASPSTVPLPHTRTDQYRLVPEQTHDHATRPGPSSATEALQRSLSPLRTRNIREDFSQGIPVPETYAGTSTPARQSFPTQFDVSPPIWQAGSPRISSLQHQQSSPPEIVRRTRAPSLGSSLSSTFVMRIPTSPLVQATNNPTLDFSPRNLVDGVAGRSARRRTMPPNAFESLQMSPLDSVLPNFTRPIPYEDGQQNEGSSFPQRHRPRRSLSSFTYQPAITPHTPQRSTQRRPSLAADMSPRQRASMVGSFEESILRGRMSTPASKPLDFVAQIGVMGKGNCPTGLKCPAHVTVPFPAVFYNYPSATSSRSISDDNPSPYVGNIDLEHKLKPPAEPVRRSRRSQTNLSPEDLAAEITKPENTAIGKALAREAQKKQEKAATSLNELSGGAYRVPQKGQLQVIIKNPNKTAVKLFLVPYDLDGMLPGTKTFVRQRSYSSGPILEAATVETQADLVARDPLSAKDILRYLIHLKFCCTAKGRFYLYDNIRVVFANRVPDGKEKLRTEVQLPDPRFSPHKPTLGSHSRSPSIADEKAFSRSQPSGAHRLEKLNDVLGLGGMKEGRTLERELTPAVRRHEGSTLYAHGSADLAELSSLPEPDTTQLERNVSPTPGFLPSTSARGSPVPWSDGSTIARSFSPTPVEAGHGLLSQKLRELNGQSDRRQE
ncbi:hypothetical protein H2200_008192 [Cladophialophora chaetospira]|uniref:Atos-like conserved domain-containing protein n=1 Tax=Cladophialophora chaetospira TaxID=386627 RepID=A0AA39CG87_9EURO|nr:hypothetical protein H2200_008192 [Cladophialophora chaetospira]